MNAQMLEILIGKYIDSEITPAEQQLLDHELAANPNAKILLDDYQQLDRLSRQAVDRQIAQSGRSFDIIFSSALELLMKTLENSDSYSGNTRSRTVIKRRLRSVVLSMNSNLKRQRV